MRYHRARKVGPLSASQVAYLEALIQVPHSADSVSGAISDMLSYSGRTALSMSSEILAKAGFKNTVSLAIAWIRYRKVLIDSRTIVVLCNLPDDDGRAETTDILAFSPWRECISFYDGVSYPAPGQVFIRTAEYSRDAQRLRRDMARLGLTDIPPMAFEYCARLRKEKIPVENLKEFS